MLPRMFVVVGALLISLAGLGTVQGAMDPPPAASERATAAAKPVFMLETGGHSADVTGLFFTPDSKRLISLALDHTIRIWDVAAGTTSRVLYLPIVGRERNHGALSADGKFLAVDVEAPKPGEPYRILIISLEAGQVVRCLNITTLKHGIRNLVFSPDGKQLAFSSFDNVVRICNAQSGVIERQLTLESDSITQITFSPDGRWLAVTELNNPPYRLTRWSTATGQRHPRDAKAPLTGSEVAWAPDGKTLATNNPNEILLWSAAGERLASFNTNNVPGTNIHGLTRDGKQLLITSSGSESSDVERYAAVVDLTADKVRAKHSHGSRGAPPLSGGRAALSPAGNLAASAFGADIHLWKVADGSLVRRLGGVNRPIWATAWSKDGKTVAWGHTNTAVGFNAPNPLEQTFHLEECTFGAKPDATFTRVTLATGPYKVTLEKEATELVMRKNGKITGKDDLYYSGIFGLTLLSDGRAVATRWIGMGLYDFREPGQDTFLGFPMGVNTTTSVSTAPGNPYVLVGNNSGILHVMPQDRLKGEMGHIPPLLSLCLAGTEWIAWTPEGYYAASPGGERLMGWQVNNGADQLANFYPAAQFRKTFYRPDVIKRLLATNSLEKALAQANQERGTSTPKITVAQALPPRVRLVRPEPTATKLTTPRLTVQAEATDPAHPIASLQLLLDGRPLQTRQIQPPRPGEITASWDIDVPAGRHRLAVKAVNDVSQALSDEVEVTYGPEGGATAAKGTLYVLAIGVNAYPGRLKLDAAVPDAQALTKAFRQHSRPLFQDVNVKLVLDQNATRRNILSELDALQREAKPGDVVVVFYAGHGDSKLTGELHLVPVDADLKNLAGTGVSGETLRAKLGNLPCTTLVILDACYSGSFSAGKKKGALPTGADKLVREFMYDDMLVVMCGAAKDQEAGEEQGHGYFTRALVEGLSGQAPKDEAGLIDLDALQLYVGRRVKKLSDGDQVPTIHRPSTVSNIPLARP